MNERVKINFTSRKFILTAILFVIATALLIFVDKISFTEWSHFCEFILAAYIGGNAVTKFAKPKDEKGNVEKNV